MTDVHGIAVAGGTFPAEIWAAFMRPALADEPAKDWPQPSGGIDWQRYCGRFQYARTYRDARPEAGCSQPTTKKTTTEKRTVTETTTETTTKQATTAPKPPPPPTTTQQQPPPPDLVGDKGKVTEDVDNDAGTGEVQIGGDRWPARSDSGDPIPKDTKVEVVRTDDRYVWVAPTG
jgi:membrane peptidoglycan carboxypeptidase